MKTLYEQCRELQKAIESGIDKKNREDHSYPAASRRYNAILRNTRKALQQHPDLLATIVDLGEYEEADFLRHGNYGAINRLLPDLSTLTATLSAAIPHATMDEIERDPSQAAVFDPWGPVGAILFGFGSDTVVEIVGFSGLTPDWVLTGPENYSHTTRKRVYLSRVDVAYKRLDAETKRRFVLNVAREIARQNPEKQELLNEALRRIGWLLIGDALIPIAVLNPEDLEKVPEVSRGDLAKAADRIPDDPTGAVSAACGAVDSATNKVFQDLGLGNPGEASFQEKVNRSLQAVGVFGKLQGELEELGWDPAKAREFCKSLQGALSQAAKVMESLRSQMGDVHGSKPVLTTLVYDSLKWATIICSLL